VRAGPCIGYFCESEWCPGVKAGVCTGVVGGASGGELAFGSSCGRIFALAPLPNICSSVITLGCSSGRLGPCIGASCEGVCGLDIEVGVGVSVARGARGGVFSVSGGKGFIAGIEGVLLD